MNDPAFLFYSSDFLVGTMFMTDEQVGKYIKLLCAQHHQGKLSKEDMLNICKTQDEKIYSKFKIDEQGFYYNERLNSEINKRKAYSESRRNNRLSSNTKPKKSTKHMNNICKSYEEHMENENININEDININKNINEIINYLNNKANSNFRNSTQKTKDLIKARFKEKFTIEDFKQVINKKVNEWIGTEWEKFLRPETLFGNKFESYLNQKNNSKQSFTEMMKEVYEEVKENDNGGDNESTSSIW